MPQLTQAPKGIRQSFETKAVKEHQMLQIDQVAEGFWQPLESRRSSTYPEVHLQQLDRRLLWAEFLIVCGSSGPGAVAQGAEIGWQY